MTRARFILRRIAKHFYRTHKVRVEECLVCGEEAVIPVDVRRVCMNCGEEQ